MNTGNNLIFLIVSALLGFMVVSGIMGMVNLHGLAVQIDLPEEIFAGSETLAAVTLKNNKKYFPSFLIGLSFINTEAFVTIVDRGGSSKAWCNVIFKDRGSLSLPAIAIYSPFPINFFVRRREAVIPLEIVVFPRMIPCAGGDTNSPLPVKQNESYGGKGYDGEFDKIIDYSGTEPMKLIHWRLSARHDELKVKKLSGTSADPITINVDGLPGKNSDERVSYAAYLVNTHLQKRQPVGLRMSDVTISPDVTKGHRLKLLSELAVYDKN